MQYNKDKTESFDYHFSLRTNNYKLQHVRNWLNPFVNHRNKELTSLKDKHP
jgi:hypothetical protein